jgi:hypothetical protein
MIAAAVDAVVDRELKLRVDDSLFVAYQLGVALREVAVFAATLAGFARSGVTDFVFLRHDTSITK